MNWFEEQVKNRIQNDTDDFSAAFAELGSVVMGEEAARAGLNTPRQRTHNAIQEILKFFNLDVIPVPEEITDTTEYINYCLKPSGIMKRRVSLTGKWWKEAYGPFLGTLVNGEIVALLPSKGGYSFYDYANGKKIPLNTQTAKLLQEHAYCFYKPFPNRALTVVDLVRYMFKTMTLSDRWFYYSIMALTTVFGMMQPRISLMLFDYIIPGGYSYMLFSFGILMVTLALSTMVLGLSQQLIMNRMTMRLSNYVEPAAMMRVLNLPPAFFKKYASGELRQKFMLISQICMSIFGAVMGTLLISLFSLAYFVQIGNIAPSLLTPSLIIIGTTLTLNIITTVVSISFKRRMLEAQATLSGMTHSMLTGIQKIKLTGSEKRVFAGWASKYKDAANFQYNPPLILKYQSVLSQAITAAGLALVYFVAIASNVGVGEYMAYMTAYGMVSTSVLALGSLTTFFASIKPQLDIIEPILKAVPEISEQKKVVTSLAGSVEVQNLTFRYEEGGRNILDGIDIKIRSGQYVAIVGKTGCGKSTLVRLLLGFETPVQGAVYFDGKDISTLDLPSLRRKIGTVLQNGKLLTGDIFSNIVISAPELTVDDAWEAAKIADIAKDIENMPMGMHTIITEGSGGVSGGQKQRLMIARAVAPKPKLLILDESTSALDNITQKHVADALAAMKCTRIVIAHRLSTIKDCDKIYVLENGKISEEGTFDELYAKGGYFHELVSRQMIDEKALVTK